MQNRVVAPIRNAAAAVLCLAAVGILPAAAQFGGAGDTPSGDADPLNIAAGYSTVLSRYYVPYALQAAAAYKAPAEFDKRRDRSERSSWDGSLLVASDVLFAVAAYPMEDNIRVLAAKYLRLWRYKFGRQGYLDCLDPDPASACRRALKAEGRKKVSDGPSYHVWARYSQFESGACDEVSIAFRGTDPNKSYFSADWAANLRRFNPLGWRYDDHYRQLRRNIDSIVDRITNLPCYKRATNRQIVSVGHSLGAGLAEFAALANNPDNNPERPRIVKVFSFNASPETGVRILDERIFLRNAERLEIDRIYQTGEINTRIRDNVYEADPPSSSRCGPQVRNVEAGLLKTKASATDLHTMKGLARELVRSSRLFNSYGRPKKPEASCSTDYRLPESDDYEPPALDLGPEIAFPPAAPSTRPAALTQVRVAVNYLRTDSFETAFGQPIEMAGSVAKLAADSGRRSTTRSVPRDRKRTIEPQMPAVRFEHAALLRD